MTLLFCNLINYSEDPFSHYKKNRNLERELSPDLFLKCSGIKARRESWVSHSVTFSTTVSTPQKMVVLIFFFCHVLCYLVSLTLRFIIYMYIKKKPLGLQSILDPLILDIVRFQVAAYTFFILFALAGITHGQLPFALSQVIIVINNSTNNFVYGLFLYFLVVKALVVFKENWIQEVSDSTNVRVSRVVAFFVAWLRLWGDFSVQEPGPGVMTKFLTGTDHHT